MKMSRKMKKLQREFWREEDGVGVVEIILILVVLIGLVVIFRAQIEAIVMNAFERITQDAGAILK